MEFVHDQLAMGTKIRALTIVDTFSRFFRRSRPSCPLGTRVRESVTRPDVSTKARMTRNGGCLGHGGLSTGPKLQLS